MKKQITIAVVALLLVSCSIQKRHHLNGYYVAWKHNAAQTRFNDTKMVMRPKNQYLLSTSYASNEVIKETFTAMAKPSINSKSIISSHTKHSTPNSQTKSPKTGHVITRKAQVFAEPQKNNPSALWALILGVGALVLPFGGLACGVLAIIFGVKGKKQIAADPSAYKGLGMAKAGVVLGIVACALWIILILLFI